MTTSKLAPASQLLYWMLEHNLPEPESEYKFMSGRQFRFDFAWPDRKVALELEGGTWSRRPMGHNTGRGINRDIEKGNHAVCLGWRVLRCTPEHIGDPQLIGWLKAALGPVDGAETIA